MKLLTGKETRGIFGGAYAVEIEIPTGDVRTYYRRMRADGTRAAHVLRSARILAEFDKAQEAGTVRLLYVADCDGSGALDWLDQTADQMAEGNVRAWTALGKRERERANSDGVYGIVGQYRTSDAEEWEEGGSVWGFIGEDGLEAGNYAPDIMAETLDALAKARGECCPACGRPKVS